MVVLRGLVMLVLRVRNKRAAQREGEEKGAHQWQALLCFFS